MKNSFISAPQSLFVVSAVFKQYIACTTHLMALSKNDLVYVSNADMSLTTISSLSGVCIHAVKKLKALLHNSLASVKLEVDGG